MVEKIRNIAIIAHVDHGKTSLVDKILQHVSSERDNNKMDERALDSNELEKERGITILAKNTTVFYNDYKINIVDTPGHADFGGEVERVLNMVEGVLLLVDAFEGPMPQTKYVLKKAMAMKLKPIVVINKVDREGSDIPKVIDRIYDLFIDLNADEAQLEFPIIYTSAKQGYVLKTLESEKTDFSTLLDLIIKEIPRPNATVEEALQLQISTLSYDNYVGVVATGRIQKGSLKINQTYEMQFDDTKEIFKITRVLGYNGLRKIDIQEAFAGDIVSIAGTNNFKVGATIGEIDNVTALPKIKVDEPTISMFFMVNDSPLAGKEGKYLTSRHLRDRLYKEALSNVALKVEETETTEAFKVSGRGELHLAILIETMRREGFELQVSKPQVIIKEIDGKKLEPYEEVTIEVPEEFSGVVIDKLNQRFGIMQVMEAVSSTTTRLVYRIPSRGLLGYRSQFLTDTKGAGILYTIFDGYDKLVGQIKKRFHGVMVSQSDGKAVAFALFNLQERGDFFIKPNDAVYEGMIVGTYPKIVDFVVNPTKKKHLTNMRASGSDEAVRLIPVTEMTLEKGIEFIDDDELVEITPSSIRLRKKILNWTDRKRANKNLAEEVDE